jgi:hypothetical protein
VVEVAPVEHRVGRDVVADQAEVRQHRPCEQRCHQAGVRRFSCSIITVPSRAFSTVTEAGEHDIRRLAERMPLVVIDRHVRSVPAVVADTPAAWGPT